MRRALKKDWGRQVAGRQQQQVRQAMHKFWDRLVIGVDATDGCAGLILQRGESAPLVDRQAWALAQGRKHE